VRTSTLVCTFTVNGITIFIRATTDCFRASTGAATQPRL
jgi:hypothetical protein